ncbi:superoxide dismutase [Sporolituus thermophilus]|uniref:superoxide dismutase n=1 Tax=Sporolituus thermophilus DSM 23256 TaxID=1123285 RepID=A0A1G7JZ54_9FIRM|nr:Fe-Mn family superoxide dismutase [Sporolituus thermophilus]SDF30197.1 superoxide dismutase, Fe-Mn family [Sporolituus thermophilus DSM 23256]
MEYKAKDYSYLIGMEGFSPELLRMHFTLYQGYVTNTNKLLEILDQMLRAGNLNTPEYNELKRHLGWEFDGMRLHEYYFENLGGNGRLSRRSRVAAAMAQNFGSVQAWEKDFRATGAIRGIGWAILYQDVTNGRLINFWINEHDKGHPAGCNPLLVMDVWEHAYMPDYGLDRAAYINAFFGNIDWRVVEERLL